MKRTRSGVPAGAWAAARELNARILAAASPAAALAFTSAAGDALNAVHCATALARCARSSSGTQGLEQPLLALLAATARVLALPPAPNARTLTSISHSVGAVGGGRGGGAARWAGEVGGAPPDADASAAAAVAAGVPPRLAAAARVALRACVSALLRSRASGRDEAGAAATALWAAGALGGWDAEPSRAELLARVGAAAPAMAPSEVSAAAWGAARCGMAGEAGLLGALRAAATAVAAADGFDLLGLANTAWAWAKLRVPAPALAAALAAAAVRALAAPASSSLAPPRIDGAALATLAWAFARAPDAPLMAAICGALQRQGAVASLPRPALASLLQTCSGGGGGGGAEPADAVSGGSGGGETERQSAERRLVVAALGARALAEVGSLGAQEVGLLCGALARGALSLPDGAQAAAAAAAALERHIAAVAAGMEWRGVAAACVARALLAAAAAAAAGDGAAREGGGRSGSGVTGEPSSDHGAGGEGGGSGGGGGSAQGGSGAQRGRGGKQPSGGSSDNIHGRAVGAALASPVPPPPLVFDVMSPTARALAARADAEAARLAAASDAADAAPGDAAIALVPSLLAAAGELVGAGSSGDGGGGARAAPRPAPAAQQPVRVLLIGADPGGRLCAALERAGAAVTRWLRFACAHERTPASAWPPAGGAWHAVAMRVPPSAEGAALAADAAARAVPPGSPLLAYGRADEGGGAPLGDAWGVGVGRAMGLGAAAQVSVNDRRVIVRLLHRRVAGRAGAVAEAAARAPAAAAAGVAAAAGDARDADSDGDDDDEAAPLRAWRATCALSLPGAHGAPVPQPRWITYPGLFAGGWLDVMSDALLRVLLREAPLARGPPRPRVLDFACGSGALAAALAAAVPGARVDACDADALACHAARQNARGARVWLRDGWGGGSSGGDGGDGGDDGGVAAAAAAREAAGDGADDEQHAAAPAVAAAAAAATPGRRARRYALIVSNPPVHRGAPDDLRLLQALLAGAPLRLRKRGELWLVTQAQVPVAALAAAAGGWAGGGGSVVAWREGGDGRFLVWRLRAAAR